MVSQIPVRAGLEKQFDDLQIPVAFLTDLSGYLSVAKQVNAEELVSLLQQGRITFDHELTNCASLGVTFSLFSSV